MLPYRHPIGTQAGRCFSARVGSRRGRRDIRQQIVHYLKGLCQLATNRNLKGLCQEQPSSASTGRGLAKILQGIPMPQIWMTYEELAGMLDCTVLEARERVHLERLDRKISRDGKNRAKLSLAMISIFIERLRTVDHVMERAVDDLRHVHGLLSESADQPGRLTPQRLLSRQSG
jgi:hypothetical protein